MAISITSILEDVRSLKASAKANTTFGDYEDALADLEKAEDRLSSELRAIKAQVPGDVEPKENRRHELASQLADTYGMIGGVYRRLAKQAKLNPDQSIKLYDKFVKSSELYDESIRMYDEGYEYERPESYNIHNSYNLTNKIVVRILRDPNSLVDQKTKIQEAIETVQEQIEAKRRGEWFAWADLGHLYLLSGKSKEARQSYEKFKSTGALAQNYESTIAVLEELKQALDAVNPPIAEAISEEIRYLRGNKPAR